MILDSAYFISYDDRVGGYKLTVLYNLSGTLSQRPLTCPAWLEFMDVTDRHEAISKSRSDVHEVEMRRSK